jgi:hypothetical protein
MYVSFLRKNVSNQLHFYSKKLINIKFMCFRNVFYTHVFANCLGQKFDAVAGATFIENTKNRRNTSEDIP